MKHRLRREIDSKLAMLGRNHRWLAGELGICRQYLSQILNNKKHSIRVVKRLAAWADVTIDEVLEMVKNES